MRIPLKSPHILAAIATFLCVACTDEAKLGGDWSPSLTPRQLSLSAYDMKMSVEGGKETVNVTAENAGWNFDGNDADWLTLTPKSGNGSAAVSLTALPNIDPTTGRSVAYAFTCTDTDWQMMRQFSVSQPALGYYVRPAEKNFTKAAPATQFEVGIEANASWEAKSDAEWLSVQPHSTSLTVSLTDNTTSLSADRIAHITLTCSNTTEIITVNQQPPCLIMADEELVYEQEGDKCVEVKSDVPWQARCSQSWITLSPSEGKAGTTSLNIHATSNRSINERAANVYVNIGGWSLRSIPIRQEGMYVKAGVTSFPAFPYQGGSQTLTITSNTDWTVINNPGFVTISPESGGKGKAKVTVTTEENLGEKSFSGDIILGNASITGLQTKVHVEQECPNIGISEQTITVSSTADSKHELTLTTNQSWTAAFQSGTWARTSTSSGNGSTTLTLTADDNPSIHEREDILTIIPAVTKTPLTFRFIQHGKMLEVSTTSLSFSPEGGSSYPIIITTDGTFSVTQTGNWFTVSQSGCNIKVSAQENTSNSTRTGNITVSLTNLPNSESLSRTISVSQDVEPIRTFTANGVKFNMVYVEGGTFEMGATCEQGNDAKDNERPVHSVTLDNYMIGQTEVTQELWEAVMGYNPSKYGWGKCPVEEVRWNDCQNFIERLNLLTNQKFRLPTEAEWEYAARGGIRSYGCKYSGSNYIDNVGWYYNNSFGYSHQVAQKQANEIGVYDMSGNVREWCQDWYGDYSNEAQINPSGPTNGTRRVIRGGSWNLSEGASRTTHRSHAEPTSYFYSIGFRLAL